MLGAVGPSPRAQSIDHGRQHPRRARMLASLSFVATLTAAFALATAATAADRIRIAAQKTGTLAWELEIIKAHGLDKKADLDIQVVELASTEAGKIALRSGSADLIVSDWLWVDPRAFARR